MKSLLSSIFWKTSLLIISLALSIGGSTVAQAGEKDPLSPGLVRPRSNYRTDIPQGYLMVYSATDQSNDGGVSYYAHISYSIYTSDGKFFKNVENHISPSDEIPAVVTLSAGSYTIEARSEDRGYVCVPHCHHRRAADHPRSGQGTNRHTETANPKQALARPGGPAIKSGVRGWC
jgi:hypothetical protein